MWSIARPPRQARTDNGSLTEAAPLGPADPHTHLLSTKRATDRSKTDRRRGTSTPRHYKRRRCSTYPNYPSFSFIALLRPSPSIRDKSFFIADSDKYAGKDKDTYEQKCTDPTFLRSPLQLSKDPLTTDFKPNTSSLIQLSILVLHASSSEIGHPPTTTTCMTCSKRRRRP